jgi:hypothetical protein
VDLRRAGAIAAAAAAVFALASVPGVARRAASPTLERAAPLPPPLESFLAEYPAAAGGAGDAVIAPPPERFDGAAVAPARPVDLPGGASSPAAQVFAVVVGINDYPGRNGDLRYAVADALDMTKALALFDVPASNRVLVTDRDATAGALERALRWLVQQAGPEDTTVVFYAGHVRQLGRGTEAIVTADGVETTDDRVATLLAPLSAGKTWIVMASCYGGGFDEVLAPQRILTAAAPAGSLAFESSAYGRSYLAEYMIRRAWLERQAGGTVEDAFAYAVSALEREHPQRVPVQFDHVDGRLAIGSSGSLGPPRRPAGSTPPPRPAGEPSGSPGSQPSSPPTTSPPDEPDDEPGDPPDGCSLFGVVCQG